MTIIIPNYNGSDDLRTCLTALQAQSAPADVIVVDDASTDESVRAAEAWMQKEEGAADGASGAIRTLTLLRHAENRGFAAAVNTGIRAAKTPYVILLNNDAFPEEGFTEALLRAIRKRKNAFAVQGLLLQARGDTPYEPEDSSAGSAQQHALIDDSGDYFCALGWAFSPGRDKEASAYSRPMRIMSACAGAAIYDRAVLEELGLFDEAHFCYLEDVDISLRAYRAGYRIYYEPEARVHHRASASSGSRYNAFKARLTIANSLYLICKNLPVWMIVLFFPLLFCGFAVKGAFYAGKGLSGAFVQGLHEGASKIAAYRRTGDVFHVEATPRREAMLAMELLGNCVRRMVG